MLAKPEACYGCPLFDEGQGFAPGEGPTRPNIVLVGEALGNHEAIQGRPFVGGTGKMLRSMLRQAELPPEAIYITNTVKCRPPANRKPSREEVDFCTSRYLFREIDDARPNLLIACGDTAFGALVPGASSITKARGYVFKGGPNVGARKVLPIVHPSYVVRGNPEFWSITVADLIKARKEGGTSEWKAPKENFIINPTIHDVRRVVEFILREARPFSFDIETVGERDQLNILCIGFGWSASEALCIPLLKRGGDPYWPTDEQEMEVVDHLWRLFTSPNTKIGQNVFTFDIPRLQELGFRVEPPVEDTLIKHHCIGLELPHSLQFLASIYTPLVDYKGVKVTLWADDQELREYNCRDCIATWMANYGIEEEMEELGLL